MILMNLFSIFDPATSLNYSLMWMSIIYVFIILPKNYWLIPSRFNFILLNLMNYLIKEFKLLLFKKFNMMNMIMFISLFLLILLNNLLGMFMYIYMATNQLVYSLSLSLTLWLSLLIFMIHKNLNMMFIHLVPEGSPWYLMQFMVLIESISNFIRFITLSVRLSANIIAGHLLMSLISSFSINLSMILIIIFMLIQIILIILEISVCFIQAYVFTVLILLYSIETN